MKATLATMAADLAAVIDGSLVIDEETGEILFEPSDLEAMAADTAEKFLAVRIKAGDYRAQAANLRELAKALGDSAKAADKRADSLEAYMLSCAKAVGGEIKTDTITVRVRKCPPSVEIYEEAQIPDAFWTEETVRSINKTLIKNEIKAGGYVPGAALVKKEKVEVR